jgi:hypothetical protein
MTDRAIFYFFTANTILGDVDAALSSLYPPQKFAPSIRAPCDAE